MELFFSSEIDFKETHSKMLLMEFQEYPSIENAFAAKSIKQFLAEHPDAQSVQWILTEKIDGANIQLLFEPHQPMRVGRRKDILTPDQNFYDIWNVLPTYSQEFAKMQTEVDRSLCALRIYGELFGKKVLERIHYGEGKYIRFFDAMIINEGRERFMTQRELLEFFRRIDLEHMFVPLVQIVPSFNEALAYDTRQLKSAFNSSETVEGIVLKPYDGHFVVNGSPFYLKKKNEDFYEQAAQNDVILPDHVDPQVADLRFKYLTYLTENRLQNVFSKAGPISSKKEIGKYIKLLGEDAQQDFLKEFPEQKDLIFENQGFIFKAPPSLAHLLMKYL